MDKREFLKGSAALGVAMATDGLAESRDRRCGFAGST